MPTQTGSCGEVQSPTVIGEHDAARPNRGGDVDALLDQEVRAVPDRGPERDRCLVRAPAAFLSGLEHDDPHAARHCGGHLIPGPERLLGADAEHERGHLDLRPLEAAGEQRPRRLLRGATAAAIAAGDASSSASSGDGAGVDRAAEAAAAAAGEEGAEGGGRAREEEAGGGGSGGHGEREGEGREARSRVGLWTVECGERGELVVGGGVGSGRRWSRGVVEGKEFVVDYWIWLDRAGAGEPGAVHGRDPRWGLPFDPKPFLLLEIIIISTPSQ